MHYSRILDALAASGPLAAAVPVQARIPSTAEAEALGKLNYFVQDSIISGHKTSI